MSKSRISQRSAGRNINNYEYKKEVSCKDNYLSDKHKEAREEFIKNNPIVPMNPKQLSIRYRHRCPNLMMVNSSRQYELHHVFVFCLFLPTYHQRLSKQFLFNW